MAETPRLGSKTARALSRNANRNNMNPYLAVIIMTLSTIMIFYLGISGYYYSKPYKILWTGLFFILFSFIYKIVVAILMKQAPAVLDINPVIDMSTAALGGNLIAASFIIRAQKEHNKTKEGVRGYLVWSKKRLEDGHKALEKIRSREWSQSDDLLPGVLKEIREIEDDITKLEKKIHDLELL